jgi:hypothetical protein
VFASRQKRSRPNTTLGRAMSSIWIAMGVSMFIVRCVSPSAAGMTCTFCRDYRGDAGHGQCHLQPDSQMEDAVCLRGGLVGSGRGCMLLASEVEQELRSWQRSSSARSSSASMQ